MLSYTRVEIKHDKNSTKDKKMEICSYNVILYMKVDCDKLKIYYKATIIKIAQYWHKNRPNNSIKSPEINPCTHSQLTFDNSVKNTQQRKDSVFSECVGTTDIHMQKNEIS